MSVGRQVIDVGEEGAGARLDVWLSEELGLSRSRVAALIEEGAVLLNDSVPRKSEVLEGDERIAVDIPAPRPVEAVAQDLPLEIVHEDSHLVVVNKPAGMVVHPAPGHPDGTLVNALLHHVGDLSGIGGELRPGIVHRLDRDTSGLLVVAKDEATHRALSTALKEREVKRVYLAAAWGHLRAGHLRIDEPIGRDPRNRKRMAVVEDGRSAITHLRVRERWPAAELLDVSLETGRTHQIRVHLASIGHPVVGDSTYGLGWERGMSGTIHAWAKEFARRVPRQFLHAAQLGFRHPATGEDVRFHAPLPDDLAAARDWVMETAP
jgi:23S rRNA pseudouridine1911/1915/1917 synthase